MRRFFIFALLIITLVTTFQLSRMIQNWHYIVPADAGDLLYATSFDGAMTDWAQDERSTFAHLVEDGVLRITASGDNERPFSAASPYFRDFDVTVTTTIQSGDFSSGNENAYGIVFRERGSSDYYSFFVSGDGFYRVVRVVDGVDIDRSTWIESEVIRIGEGAINVLRVTGYDDQFQFYINDQLMTLCVPNQPDGRSTIHPLTGECLDGELTDTLIDDNHSFGRIAMTIFGDQAQDVELTVTFDDVVIYAAQSPEPSTEAIPETTES